MPLGVHWFAREAIQVMLGWSGGVFTFETWKISMAAVAPWVVADNPGGIEAVRAVVDPRFSDILASDPGPAPTSAVMYTIPGSYTAGGQALDVHMTGVRVRNDAGAVVGTAFFSKPAAGMSVLGTITSAGDLGHFERMQRVARHARRPSAILFGDLEGSSALARRMSTGGYFALGRRLVRLADRSVVDAEGLVGRHAGDGLVAIFPVETAGSESAAAAASVRAMREVRAGLPELAERSGLVAEDVVMRFGLHWGATLHVGHIATVARAEVNALGDEMNEAARIEACATGGRALASKSLIERLETSDAADLDLDLTQLTYTPLSELPSATDKARRDAPAIAVAEI